MFHRFPLDGTNVNFNKFLQKKKIEISHKKYSFQQMRDQRYACKTHALAENICKKFYLVTKKSF